MDEPTQTPAAEPTNPNQTPPAPTPTDQPTPAAPPVSDVPVNPVEITPEPVSAAPALVAATPAPSAAETPAAAPTAPAAPDAAQSTTPGAVPGPTPGAAPTAAAKTGKKILLVEDDDALASVYVTRLQAEGFDVKRVPNGEDALSTALQFHPDLILLDVMMPKVSGFDVLDILRNTPETANIKVIMLTALSQDTDKERATKLGADDYLVKSQVVIADVVDRIRHHLNVK